MLASKPGRLAPGAASLLLLLLLSLLLSTWPGAARAGPRTLRFERLSVEQGLSQQSVLTILQDRRGFMWFGTQAGLNRYDGYRITGYRNEPGNPDSIPDNYVMASYEDAQGRLWFGTKGGLARFDGATGRFLRYAPPDEASRRAGNRSVFAIVPARDGGLWLATGDGLLHADPASGRVRTFRHDPLDPSSLGDDRVNALALDGKGNLWIGTAAGLDRLAPGANRFEHHAIDPQDAQRNTVLALSMGPRDTLWIGTGAGLEAWRLGQGAPERRRLGPAEGIGEVRILALYHDSGSTLWVGTDMEGLKWLDPAGGRFLTYRNDPSDQHSLADNQVSAMLVDRTGTLWAGTQYGGVSRTDLASGGFARYGVAEGLGRAKVRAIAEDPDGRVWIGTTGDGLLRMDGSGGRIERIGGAGGVDGTGADAPGDVVTALAVAHGRTWIGTPTGLLWRNAGGRIGGVALGAAPGASYVQALHAGRSGTLWIVTRGGLAALAPGSASVRSWRHDPDDPATLGENYGFAVLEDRRGIVWIGTENGLERYDPASGRFSRFRHDPRDPNGLRHSRVYYLMESSRGELWVGTAGGLHRMEGGPDGTRFRFYPFMRGREALAIGAVLEDRHGALWASTTAGITRLDPASGQVKNYTSKDGLVDGAYFVGAGLRARDGRFYFGGVNGMTAFQPDAVRDNPYPPKVAITDFLVLNRSRAIPDIHDRPAMTLSHRDTVFTVEFAALHYADPDANRYAYQLEGFDSGWVEADARRRFATYTNLDPGPYVFRVRASNKDGVWSPEATTLDITITPPFWKTWWFRGMAVLAVLALFTAGYRLRIRALVGQKQLLEREVGARTDELRRQKESAERRKGEVEAQKEVVEQAHRNIALLSDIGRALTANLDKEAIMRTLYEQVRALMDASLFAVVMRRPERGMLEYVYAVVDGERRPSFEVADDPAADLAAWSIAHGREVREADLARALPAELPGHARAAALPCAARAGMEARALLVVPVMVGERVLGALTVQSRAPGAYGQVHLDMLETLAAYVGVAFDNAAAYRQLKETQAQLAAREKLASLGSLVAGVAHELNTPLGNSLLMASTLQERTGEVAARFDAASLRRSDLADYMAASREATSLIQRSLHNAAELVNSFRQVSVDQASAQRRRFELAQACQEIAATMMNTVRLAGHRLELAVPPGIVMDGFPGPLGQVMINFVNNALLHAFEGPGGCMRIEAAPLDGGAVRIVFRDDGRGIPPEHQARIFDPFFTTRMGRGGTGLGLNICWNIVTTLLGGTVRADSTPGRGTAFVLELPLRAPDQIDPRIDAPDDARTDGP